MPFLHAHEVRPGDHNDQDWALSSDWAEEMELRAKRNEMIREMLQEGKTVAYRQSGWSLWPRVHSNDLCCYIPVPYHEQVAVDDIVFCHVQPGDRYYAHLVHTKEWDAEMGQWKSWISNMKRRCSGHCSIEHIFGKLVSVLH